MNVKDLILERSSGYSRYGFKEIKTVGFKKPLNLNDLIEPYLSWNNHLINSFKIPLVKSLFIHDNRKLRNAGDSGKYGTRSTIINMYRNNDSNYMAIPRFYMEHVINYMHITENDDVLNYCDALYSKLIHTKTYENMNQINKTNDKQVTAHMLTMEGIVSLFYASYIEDKIKNGILDEEHHAKFSTDEIEEYKGTLFDILRCIEKTNFKKRDIYK